MKKLLALMCMVPAIVFGGSAKDIKDHLNTSFDVTNVTFVKGVLRIVVNERMITQDVYLSVFENGLVLYSLGYSKTKGALKGVKKIVVLNKFEKKGFVFEGTEADLVKFGEYKRNQFKVQLLGRSKVY